MLPRLLVVPWTPSNSAAAHPWPVVKSLKNDFARNCFFISRLSPCYNLVTIYVNVKSRTFPPSDVPRTQDLFFALSSNYLDFQIALASHPRRFSLTNRKFIRRRRHQ